jgi:hypothetical protein
MAVALSSGLQAPGWNLTQETKSIVFWIKWTVTVRMMSDMPHTALDLAYRLPTTREPNLHPKERG